ncbi:MAG: hypothetical protein HC815_39395 [Richelia sp. RM1_1_1]|nr:hypothetical protein [Richelia sp. SM1_7_0]NJN13636.1 hypothetical protein [Richelia sp. RM1_1_1]
MLNIDYPGMWMRAIIRGCGCNHPGMWMREIVRGWGFFCSQTQILAMYWFYGNKFGYLYSNKARKKKFIASNRNLEFCKLM